MVWALIITHGVDSYQAGDWEPRTEVFLFDSESKCHEKLSDYVIDKFNEILRDDEDPLDHYQERTNVVLKYCTKNEDGHWQLTYKQVTDDDSKIIYEWVVEAKWISAKWSYDIEELTIG
jgi:hypothetical protein